MGRLVVHLGILIDCGMRLAVPLTLLALVTSTAAGAQASGISDIPDAVWSRMQGRSWHADLPCAPRAALALVTVPYHDFNGASREGTLVVGRDVARQVVQAFQEIHDSGRFRIAKIRPIDDYDGDDDASMADDNTSGFNCRRVDGNGGLSKHALGHAIDINPIETPYRTASETAPPAGRVYDTEAKRRAGAVGMIQRGDVVTRAFARIGWAWGGDFKTIKDWQHFAR